MEEKSKLLSVLRRIARATRYIEWTKSEPDATRFCVAQYNRVLARLSEIEPAVGPLFTPLADTTSPEVIRMACRDVIAYFDVDDAFFVPSVPPAPPVFDFRCGSRSRRRGWTPFVMRCD